MQQRPYPPDFDSIYPNNCTDKAASERNETETQFQLFCQLIIPREQSGRHAQCSVSHVTWRENQTEVETPTSMLAIVLYNCTLQLYSTIVLCNALQSYSLYNRTLQSYSTMLYNLTLSTIVLSLQSYSTIVLYNALQSYSTMLYNRTLQSYSTIVLYSTVVLCNAP